MSHQKIYMPVSQIPAGMVVRVNCGLYDHLALMGDSMINGERTVLSFSARHQGLAEVPFSAFAENKQVKVDGHLGTLHPNVVLERARLKKGHPYCLMTFNCEHFIRYAHAVQVESPQVTQWMLLLKGLGVLFALSRALTLS